MLHLASTNTVLRASSCDDKKWEANLAKMSSSVFCTAWRLYFFVFPVSPIWSKVSNGKISRTFLFLLVFLCLKYQTHTDIHTGQMCCCIVFWKVETEEANPTSKKPAWPQGTWLLLKCKQSRGSERFTYTFSTAFFQFCLDGSSKH